MKETDSSKAGKEVQGLPDVVGKQWRNTNNETDFGFILRINRTKCVY